MHKNWRSQNLDFPSFTKFVCRTFFGVLQLMQISLNLKTSCCNLKLEKYEKSCERPFLFMFFFWNIFHFNQNFSPLCRKTLLNMTHDRKRISKFPHMILKSFRITAVLMFIPRWKNIDYWIWSSSKFKLSRFLIDFLGKTS